MDAGKIKYLNLNATAENKHMRLLSFSSVSFFFLCISSFCAAQVTWQNVDHLYTPLPQSFHVFKTTDSLDGKPNIAYYAIADLGNKKFDFTVDTTYNRRLTPQQFFQKNGRPLLVVNCTFFSLETNQNLNIVIKDEKLLSYNARKVRERVGDTTSPFKDEKIIRGAFGISKKRNPDIAWISTDSTEKYAHAYENVLSDTTRGNSKRWKMRTAVGGGPVLVQDGKVFITNEQEKMFIGNARMDKHPRTCIGYTTDGKLIIMVIEGRYPGIAEGATLEQEARLLIQLGCTEGLNLDGGGSSCMLVNGKETITPSEKGIERPVPAVFLINQ